MKTTFSLLVVSLLLPIAAHAQLTPPPIKMGLWRTNSTVTIAGIQIPPEAAARLQAMGKSVGQPQTASTLSCLTPEKWQDAFNRKQRDQNCQFSNEKQSSSGMSADIVCTSADGKRTTNGHLDMKFLSEEKIEGTVHIESQMRSQPQPMVMDNKFDGVYQGADCQGISPDSPKIVK